MKILKNLLIGVVALIALIIIIGLFLPREARVERSITIATPPDVIYSILSSFERFNDWSPWAEQDPDAEYVYEGPERGVGAKMSWSSDDPGVGSGSQEIIEVEADRMVRTSLDFGEQGAATATFMLDPTDSGTRVTWSLETTFENVLARYFGLFFDSMIGPDYERGLANLKVLAEQIAAAEPASVPDDGVELVQVEPAEIVYLSGTTTRDPADIGAAFADSFSRLERFMEQHALSQAGPPRAIVNFLDESGYGFDAAIPVAGDTAALPADDEIKVRQSYGGRAACARHVGSYSDLGAAHEMIEAYMALNDLQPSGKAWEEYLNDPEVTAETELITRVCYPIAG